jgi:hypothetical protein
MARLVFARHQLERRLNLQLLFRPFGHTTRIFLAKDRKTGRSRGFAFINYANRADAQRAFGSSQWLWLWAFDSSGGVGKAAGTAWR